MASLSVNTSSYKGTPCEHRMINDDNNEDNDALFLVYYMCYRYTQWNGYFESYLQTLGAKIARLG